MESLQPAPAADPREQPGDKIQVQLARRRKAARRLPPLACGCRDPEHRGHRTGRCRYTQRRSS
jgi:hypothetical protein